jgi:hypothetical protein
LQIQNTYNNIQEQISNWKKETFQEKFSGALADVGKEISERSSFVTVYTQQGKRLNKLMSDMVSKVITKPATIQVYCIMMSWGYRHIRYDVHRD